MPIPMPPTATAAENGAGNDPEEAQADARRHAQGRRPERQRVLEQVEEGGPPGGSSRSHSPTRPGTLPRCPTDARRHQADERERVLNQ